MKYNKKKVLKHLKRKLQRKIRVKSFLTEESIKRTLKIPWVKKMIEELKDM